MFSSQFYRAPDKESLRKQYVGAEVQSLPTPSVLIDLKKFKANAARMLSAASALGVDFRCHVKTHKALEGVEIQLGHNLGADSPTTNKIIVSTLAEAWLLVPLMERGIIGDVLFGLPVAKLKLAELLALSEKVKELRLMVDTVEQVQALTEFAKAHGHKWSVFVKVDMGYGRAGIPVEGDNFEAVVDEVMKNEEYLSLYGYYCHAGQSYGASTSEEAKSHFFNEVRHVNSAAKKTLKKYPLVQLQLSVGATPTAHFSQKVQTVADIEAEIGEGLAGRLEVHAGNYPCCDLQQVATSLVGESDVSLLLLVEVLSRYEGRNGKTPGEQLINAGAIALSRETGPFPGHGNVVTTDYGHWYVGKVSQEHGILYPGGDDCKFIPYGTKVTIIPQHACITACAHAWYYVVEDNRVVDVWVPAKLW